MFVVSERLPWSNRHRKRAMEPSARIRKVVKGVPEYNIVSLSFSYFVKLKHMFRY